MGGGKRGRYFWGIPVPIILRKEFVDPLANRADSRVEEDRLRGVVDVPLAISMALLDRNMLLDVPPTGWSLNVSRSGNGGLSKTKN